MLDELPAKQTLLTFHLYFTVGWYLKTKILRMAAPLICFSLWLIADAPRMRARQACTMLPLTSQPPTLSSEEASSTSWGLCVYQWSVCFFSITQYRWQTLISFFFQVIYGYLEQHRSSTETYENSPFSTVKSGDLLLFCTFWGIIYLCHVASLLCPIC